MLHPTTSLLCLPGKEPAHSMPIEIHQITAEDALWPALTDHLQRVMMARHALTDGAARPDTYYLAACTDDTIVGHISIHQQPLIAPASYLTQNEEKTLKRHSQPLSETFVQTFAVEEDHRRRGYGRILQQAALDLTVQLGAYQMRSWSSADKQANYALKLSMGFAALPALYPMPGGQPISGVYFAKVVADALSNDAAQSKNATSR